MSARIARYAVVSLLLAVGMRSAHAAQLALEEGESQTIQGEVIDPALYLREGRHGPEAEDLIYEAADAGQTLALLEDGTQTIYLFLASEPGEDPNEFLYDHIGHRVSVTGFVYERGGLKGIVPTDVFLLETEEPAQPPESRQEVVE